MQSKSVSKNATREDGKANHVNPVTVSEIKDAESCIIRALQAECFAEDLKILKENNPDKELRKQGQLSRLDPFIDSNGTLRVGGRLKNSDTLFDLHHPVILPRNHHITQLIIGYVHNKVGHQGKGITVNCIRSCGYWIVGCGKAVSEYIFKCVTCRKIRGSTGEPKMADLPVARRQEAPPFTYVGMDCFGSFHIKEGRKELKRYGVLFTCLASRAIHVEVTTSLGTDSFLNALRRFISLRGDA